MTSETTTQQIWRWLGSPAWPPPELKRAPRFGADDACWLCGGAAGPQPWPRASWLTPTFTNHTLAAAPWSNSICQACAYLGSGDAWREYCQQHPEMDLKSVPPLSWRTYSHVFAANGLHICPGRRTWRTWLACPPPPPFVFVLAESGQKHVIYRARVSASREQYWVQVEEDSVLVERAELLAVLLRFESLLERGFTRDEIASGRYSQGRLGKAGLGARVDIEEMAAWRRTAPQLVRIAATAAHGPQKEEPAA